MTEPAIAPALDQGVVAVAANTPPFVHQDPPPGWTSSEFVSTVGVHLLNALAILLDLVHVKWDKGLSSMQALIPVAALAISAVLQALYQNRRTQLKITHAQQAAQVKIEQLKQLGGVVVPAAQLGEAIVTTVNPDLKPQLDQINAQVQRLHDAVFGPATAAAPAPAVDPAAWSGGSAAAPTPPPTAPPQSIPTSPPPTSPPCIEQTVQLPADDQPTETLPPLYIDPTVVTDPRQ